MTDTWTKPDVPDEERTVESLCYEWQVVTARMHYDLALAGPERPDEVSDAIIGAAYDRRREIVQEVAGRNLMTVTECEVALGMFKRETDDGSVTEEAEDALLQTVYSGLIHLVGIERADPVDADAMRNARKAANERRQENVRARRGQTEPA